MTIQRAAVSRLICLVMIGILAASGMMVIARPSKVHAAALTERSVQLENVTPGATTQHTFTFSFASTAGVGSMQFEYCTTPLLDITCVAPTGMDASAATLTTQIGETNFFVLTSQTNRLILTRAPAIPPTQNPSTYVFSNVKNPTGTPDSFFVRITTYGSMDASDAPIDFGAVANATADSIFLNTEVPPILKFCVGLTLASDCTTEDESVVDLGDLSSARASSGSSQMMAATNAPFGLAVAAYGTTMTSGNNTIPALASPTVSAPGNAQFGLNLRKNTDPAVGQEPAGAGVAVPATAYNTPNRYMFNSGDVVATSPNATDTRLFTASYVVNVSPGQAPGVYTATLTYICTATF